MSGRQGLGHGHGAAPRLVQRGRAREQRVGRFVVAGPASNGAEQSAGDAYRAGESLSGRFPPEHVGQRQLVGDVAPSEGAASSGSRRRGQRAQTLDYEVATDSDPHADGDAVAWQHQRGWAGTGSSPGNGPGSLVWGARIDERLDRLERLVEVASARSESTEEQVAAVLRRCSDQREELEELRFEFRRKPAAAPAPPEPPPTPRQSKAVADALEVQELAAQVQALQRNCNALAPRIDEVQATIGASQRQDIADKVRAMSKESKQLRVELAGVRDELSSTAQQTQRLGRETEASITAVQRRMDEWQVSGTKTEQTLMAELHELSRTSAEAVKRLSTVESDYQIFLMKMERHEHSAQEMDEQFADFSLAKEEIDQGIESLAKQQKEFQLERARTDAALAHLQEETGSLHASTTAFRGELDEASQAAQGREADIKRLVEELDDRTRQQLEQSNAAQDEAQVALEERIQHLVSSTADELVAKAKAEDVACSEILCATLEQSVAKLQDSIGELSASTRISLTTAQEKIDQDMQQLRVDDASLRNDTEQIARELTLKMQHTFQDLGRRSDQMAEQLARNMEGMGDELAANTNKALQELAARMAETEVEEAMSKLVIRAAIERNREGISDLQNDTAARFHTAQAHVDKLQQAQSDDLASAIEAIEEQLKSVQAEGRAELAAGVAEAEENLRKEASERNDHVDDVQATLSKHLKSLAQKSGRKIAGLKAETTDRMDQQHRDIIRLIETLHAAVSEELVSHQQDTAQMERDVEQRFVEIQTETATVVQALRSDAVQAEVELRQEIDHRFKETELSLTHASMISRLVDQSTTKAMFDDMQTAIVAAESRCGENLDLVASEIKRKIVAVHERLEEVDLHHCAQGLTIRAVVETELERAAADRLGLHTLISETNGSLCSKAEALQESFADGLRDLSSRLDTEKQLLVHRIDSSCRALHLLQKLMGRADSADIFFEEMKAKGGGERIALSDLQAGFRRMGQHLSDADARAVISLAASDEDGSIDPADFTQVSRLAKQAEALSSRLTDGLSSCTEALNTEVSVLTANINTAVTQLRSDATVMLEQRVEPCEQKIDQLRVDTSNMLEERILPCEQSITQLREDTSVMLEQRVKPCEEKVDALRADTRSMMEERIEPCETKISTLQSNHDSFHEITQSTISSNCIKLEQLAARADDLNQQFQWTTAILEEESQRREAVENAVGAVWLKVDESLQSMQTEIGATIVEKIEPCVEKIGQTQHDLGKMKEELGQNLRAEVESIDTRLGRVMHDVDTTVTTKLVECNTAILQQDEQLSALTARLLNLREESQWQIEAATAEAESAMLRVAGLAASIGVGVEK